MGTLLRLLTVLCFLLLMLVKVSALHVYSHQEKSDHTTEDCTWCILAVKSQKGVHNLVMEYEFSEEPFVFYNKRRIEMSTRTFEGSTSVFDFYLRPPPFII